MHYRIICVIALVVTIWAPEAMAQRKGLISSDQLLQMALDETNKHKNYEKAIVLCKKALKQSPGYTDVQLLLGRLYALTGNAPAARMEWLEVLKKQPPDRQALDYLVNLESSLGRSGEAVCYIDIALGQAPFDKELLFKKHGLLAEAKLSVAAEAVLTTLINRYPNDAKVRAMQADAAIGKEQKNRPAEPSKPAPDPALVAMDRLETDMAAARKTNNTARQQAIAQKMLQLNPAKRDAYITLINSHHARGQYDEALGWCNKAIAKLGGDEELLRRKTGLLLQLQRNSEAAAITRRLLQLSGAARDLQAYRDVQLQRAAGYDRAGNHVAAVAVLDSLLQYTPADTLVLFKKAGLLEAMKQYEDAAAISRRLMQIAPANPAYARAYADQRLAAAYQYLRNNQPAAARPLLTEAVAYTPRNIDAWMALINLENAAGNTQSAIALCDRALAALGAETSLLTKKSALLQSANRLREAHEISGALLQAQPGDAALKQMYADQLMAHGRQLQQLQVWDTALAVLHKAYDIQPTDTLLIQQLVNNYLALHQYDSAVAYANSGLQLLPGHQVLLMKKAAAQEAMHDYKGAAATVAMLARTQPENRQLRQYHQQLRSKTMHNQIGVSHLQSIYDNGSRPANVTALQYLRFHKKGSAGGRISYADRAAGSGVQLEAETYYTHSTRYYSYGILGWSTGKVFPKIRAGYSLFRNFGHDWEAELGARYLQTDSASNYALVGSVAKLWGGYWANLRGYVITEEGNWYQAYTLTNRFYLNGKKDYVAFTLALGNTPDDRARNYQFNNNASFLAGGAGLGFQKTLAYRTTFGVFGNWTYQRLTNNRHYNQYDIYLSLMHNF